MAAPTGHDWKRKEKMDEEETDPVEEMIKKTGCIEKHYAVQDCMADHQDWRKCQTEVTQFRKCMMDHQMKKAKESS